MMIKVLQPSRLWVGTALVTVGLFAGNANSATAIQSLRLLDVVHHNADGTLTCAKWCDLLGPCC